MTPPTQRGSSGGSGNGREQQSTAQAWWSLSCYLLAVATLLLLGLSTAGALVFPGLVLPSAAQSSAQTLHQVGDHGDAQPPATQRNHYLLTREGLVCLRGCEGLNAESDLALLVAPAGVNHQIALAGTDFTPNHLDITVGDSVTWTNGNGFHNVRADDDSFRCADGCDGDAGNGSPASAPWTFTLTFGDVATIPYFCEIHGGTGGFGMSGVVNVMAGDLIFSDGFESGSVSAWTSSTR